MSSAVKLFLGVSILAMAAGFTACDGGSSDPGGGSAGLVTVAGSGNSAGAGNAAGATPGGGAPGGGASSGGAPGGGDSAGGVPGGGGDLAAGVPLTPTDGWVDGMSNTLMIQGALFPYADTTSMTGMTSDFTGTNACIKGSAAKVVMPCTVVAPATDCYGTYWGAAIGLNLNQPIDMTTMMGGTPVAFDASSIKGFAFEVSGTTVPAPKDFRFKVENAAGEFCNIPTKKILLGANTVLFSELVSACYKITTNPPNPTAETAQSALIKIAWQVVTNTTGAVPFDFCISNIRAIPK